jgi:hypothetical protein
MALAGPPVGGGTFEGPRLRGTIVPGSADWQLLRSDGVLEMDLRFTLRTDDGALISMSVVWHASRAAEIIAAIGRGETVDRRPTTSGPCRASRQRHPRTRS